jgi:hypothetical protein
MMMIRRGRWRGEEDEEKEEDNNNSQQAITCPYPQPKQSSSISHTPLLPQS